MHDTPADPQDVGRESTRWEGAASAARGPASPDTADGDHRYSFSHTVTPAQGPGSVQGRGQGLVAGSGLSASAAQMQHVRQPGPEPLSHASTYTPGSQWPDQAYGSGRQDGMGAGSGAAGGGYAGVASSGAGVQQAGGAGGPSQPTHRRQNSGAGRPGRPRVRTSAAPAALGAAGSGPQDMAAVRDAYAELMR